MYINYMSTPRELLEPKRGEVAGVWVGYPLEITRAAKDGWYI
jgi:hypothetical protein